MNHSIGWTPWKGDIMVDVSITISNIKAIRRDKMATLVNDFMEGLEAAEVSVTESKEDDYQHLARTQNEENHQDQARQRYLRKRLRDRYMHSRASVVSQNHKQPQRPRENNDRNRDCNNPPLCQAHKCAYKGNKRSRRKARPYPTSRDTLQSSRIDDTI